MLQRLFIFYILLYTVIAVSGQSISRPYQIQNYTPAEYKLHPNNNALLENDKNVFCFANVYGVLTFDGADWEGVFLPQGKSASALFEDGDSIYVGSLGEFGVIQYEENGNPYYESIAQRFYSNEQAASFGRVNKIEKLNDTILFVTDYLVLKYFSGKIDTLFYQSDLLNPIVASFKINQQFFVQLSDLYLLNPYQIKKKYLPVNRIFSVKEFYGDYYCLLGNKLMKVNDSLDFKLIKQFDSTLKFKDFTFETGNIVWLATNQSGLIKYDLNDDKLTFVDKRHGLLSNKITAIYIDKRHTLWATSNLGISTVDLKTALSHVGFEEGIEGLGYYAQLFAGKLFLGTSEGLYVAAWDKQNQRPAENFHLFKGYRGAVWSMIAHGEVLYINIGKKLFSIDKFFNDKCLKENIQNESWSFLPINTKYAINGNNNGIDLFVFDGKKYAYKSKIIGFDESTRIFEWDQDHNYLWVCHGNNGLFRLTLDIGSSKVTQVINVNKLNNLPPDYFIGISIVQEHILASSSDGIFKVDKDKCNLVKDSLWLSVLGENCYVNKIISIDENNVSVFLSEDLKFFNINNEIKETYFLEDLSNKWVGVYEFLKQLDSNLYVVGTQKGFAFFNSNHVKDLPKLNPRITKIVQLNEHATTLVNLNFINQNKILKLPYQANSIEIQLASGLMDWKNVYFSTALQVNKGDTIWSDWHQSHYLPFHQLREGNYQLFYKVKYQGQIVQGSYSWIVLPPWYRSWYMYLFYTVSLFVLLYIIAQKIQLRFQNQRMKLEEQKQQALDLMNKEFQIKTLANQKEIMLLKNNQLANDLDLKDRELAAISTQYNQKSEFLSFLKEKLKNMDKSKIDDGIKFYREINKLVDQHFDHQDDQWETFKLHFDKVNHQFIQRLEAAYPKFDKTWLLLCAYIRLKKSNKEIANLLNISLAAVEKRRYRLKDKLNLDSDDNLVDFIVNF